jgi:hypothetical protein
MPYSRPGYMYYATATVAHDHGAPVIYDGVAGVAVKQKAPSGGAAAGAPQRQIANGEQFAIISKGIVQVPNTITAIKGSPVYITAGHALTLTGPGAGKFGRVVEIAGQRGTPTGMMRVDLDKKDSFV